MNKLEAVFWDVDGTIADTELGGHRVAFNLAFQDRKLDWYWDEKEYLELLKVSGSFDRILFYRNKIQSELTDKDCSKIQSRKRHYYKELINAGKIKVREGVLRLMDQLASLGIEQYIVTTSGKDSVEPLLRTSLNSFYNRFVEVITYEDVNRHKPFPDAYDLAIKSSKKSHYNCIAIEDSSIGVDAAKAANLSCLLTLPIGTHDLKNINKKANACVDSLGSNNNPSNLIYGKSLINEIVDYDFLTNIIN